MPTSLIATGRFIGLYPLKQFAPVIHENHRIRAASRWAKTLRRTIRAIFPQHSSPLLLLDYHPAFVYNLPNRSYDGVFIEQKSKKGECHESR